MLQTKLSHGAIITILWRTREERTVQIDLYKCFNCDHQIHVAQLITIICKYTRCFTFACKLSYEIFANIECNINTVIYMYIQTLLIMLYE